MCVCVVVWCVVCVEEGYEEEEDKEDKVKGGAYLAVFQLCCEIIHPNAGLMVKNTSARGGWKVKRGGHLL